MFDEEVSVRLTFKASLTDEIVKKIKNDLDVFQLDGSDSQEQEAREIYEDLHSNDKIAVASFISLLVGQMLGKDMWPTMLEKLGYELSLKNIEVIDVVPTEE